MENKPNKHDLADSISKLIQCGITIDGDVMHYIDSTFLNPSAEEFHRILADPSNCESDTVFELIFYPDLKMQENIESILKTNNYNEADIEFSINCLAQKQIRVPVAFPDHRGTLLLPLPERTLRQFINRLNITKTINYRFCETLSGIISDESDIHRVRVMLRNSRTDFTDPVIVFLCTCIEKMYAASDYFWDALTFLLNFFDYSDSEQGIYFSLMREKKVILNSINQSETNEKALKSNSVEALMLKGVNILSINVADARKKIILIDHICISIFGKTELYGHINQDQTPVTVKSFSW